MSSSTPSVLYVTGFSKDVRARDLVLLFEQVSPVRRVDVPVPNKRNQNIKAFVQYDNDKDAEIARTRLNGAKIGRNVIQVCHAMYDKDHRRTDHRRGDQGNGNKRNSWRPTRDNRHPSPPVKQGRYRSPVRSRSRSPRRDASPGRRASPTRRTYTPPRRLIGSKQSSPKSAAPKTPPKESLPVVSAARSKSRSKSRSRSSSVSSETSNASSASSSSEGSNNSRRSRSPVDRRSRSPANVGEDDDNYTILSYEEEGEIIEAGIDGQGMDAMVDDILSRL